MIRYAYIINKNCLKFFSAYKVEVDITIYKIVIWIEKLVKIILGSTFNIVHTHKNNFEIE